MLQITIIIVTRQLRDAFLHGVLAELRSDVTKETWSRQDIFSAHDGAPSDGKVNRLKC